MSPSVHRGMQHNQSAPASPVRSAESRMTGSRSSSGADALHRHQPSLTHPETIHADRVHTTRYVDRPSSERDSGYSDRSRIDHMYSDYAYVRASSVNHPQFRDAVSDCRTAAVGSRGAVSDGIYSHPYHHIERSPREVSGTVTVNAHQPVDANLYHIASSRATSYASSLEELPITAAATSSRFLDPTTPTPQWAPAHEAAYRRQNGDVGNPTNLYVGSSQYANSDTSLPDRSYDAMPRRLASPPVHYETPPHVRAAAADASCDSVELSPPDQSTVVLRGQNYLEVSKPFEMADVYKYSARMRRGPATDVGDRSTDMRSSSSPHLTSHIRDPLPSQSQRPSYVAPNPQYLAPASRHYRKPAFD